MGRIAVIKAWEIIASSGLPTIECEVTTEEGVKGKASVAYGISAGSLEATTLTDNNLARFGGKGMEGVCKKIEGEIFAQVMGIEVSSQIEIDRKMVELDGTKLLSRLGGNAILAVSLACARTASSQENLQLYEYLRQTYDLAAIQKLPKPMMVAIEGGKHADKSTDIQEYLLSVVGSSSPRENIRVGLEVYVEAKKILKSLGLSTNVGNEGAFAPEGLGSNTKPLDILRESIEKAGYIPGKDVYLSMDVAASELFRNGEYYFECEKKNKTVDQMLGWYEQIDENYPLLSLEDPFGEKDWEGWVKVMAKLGGKIQIIADDLTVSKTEMLKMAIGKKTCNGVLIKLNQAGSLSETVATCKLAKENNFMIIPSHRGGGESNDSFVVDLAVAVGGDFIKVGPTRGERVEKYNRLMEIEREVN